MLNDLFHRAVAFATLDRTVDAARAVLIVALTVVMARLARRWVRTLVQARMDVQRAVLAGRLAVWVVLGLGLAAAFEELGFKLHVLLGAAGVLSVAVGFAAQTTLSNLLSGFFLFGERPFQIGDSIEIDGISGEVLGIEMMSTTLRTPDNRFIRLPNELLIKTKLTNQTRFPTRRLEVTVTIAHSEDFDRVRTRILDVATRNPLCLSEPAPSVFIASFGETSASVQIWLWTQTKSLQALRGSVTEAIHRELVSVQRMEAGKEARQARA